LTIVVDKLPFAIPHDNLRGLTQDFILQLDTRFGRMRMGTRYGKARLSDLKVFIAASRNPRSIADIARDHAVSRQAIQASVQRLVALDVVELLPHPKNHRDKIVSVTERGWEARQQALKHIDLVEKECAEILGAKGLEQFRAQLLALTVGLKAREMAGSFGDEPEDDTSDI
jgi:DNA-binding MarR family transcriptional regulator